jgi:ABC-2 type transport system permease protein
MTTEAGMESGAWGEARAGNAGATAAQPISWGRQFYWSVQREIWENRAIYLAPMTVAGLIVIGFLIGASHRLRSLQAAMRVNTVVLSEDVSYVYGFVSALIMGATLLVAIFYCLSALYGDRRDRSILFWKSLPVSDVTTVMAKAFIPIVVLPLVTFAITVATHAVMVVIDVITASAGGVSTAQFWSDLSPFSMWGGLFYHLITVHALWYAPMFGWLLLVSAWAKRLPILWAILPPAAIAIVEKIAFNTSHFAQMLGNRLGGPGMADPSAEHFRMPGMLMGGPLDFLTQPGLWGGLLVTALFLAAAVRLRKVRGPI